MSKRVGCDFGIRPRWAILSDVTFVDHLKAHQALGYGVLPSFGLLIKPPVLYYLFDDDGSARECFTIFKKWVDHSNDGDAVSLTFIEFDDGAYGLITAPDLDRLIDRTLPSSIREEFEPLTIQLIKCSKSQDKVIIIGGSKPRSPPAPLSWFQWQRDLAPC